MAKQSQARWVALAVPMAVALAACGSTNDAQPTSSGTSGGASASVSTSASAAPTPSASTSPSAPAAGGSHGANGSRGCATSHLGFKIKAGGEAAGSAFYTLTMTNKGKAACASGGYGGVSFAKTQGGPQVGPTAQRDTSVKAKPFTLAPGASATARLQLGDAMNWPAKACRPTKVGFLKVYPPNQTQAAYIAHSFTVCAKTPPKNTGAEAQIQPYQVKKQG